MAKTRKLDVLVRSLLVLFSVGYTSSLKSCQPGNSKLQAVDRGYTYDPLQHTDNKIIGRLSVCPRDNEVHGADLLFQLVSSQVTGMKLEENTGFFEFLIPEGASESIYMDYIVTAGQESSDPAQIIIHIPGPLDGTLFSLADISGTEGNDIPMDLGLLNLHGDVTVALCNCDEDITCNYYTGNCNCRLNLPKGWQIYDSNDQPLRKHRLTNMDIQQLNGLFLRAYYSGEKCLDIHEIRVERWDYDPQSAQLHKRKSQLHIRITPSDRNLTIVFDGQRPSQEPMVLHTKEGQPIQLVHLEVQDHDGNEGKYHVKVSVDEGGNLWIRQDIRDDVLFYPKLASFDPFATLEVQMNPPLWVSKQVGYYGQHSQLEDGNGFINILRFTDTFPEANAWQRDIESLVKREKILPRPRDGDSDFYQNYKPQDRDAKTNNGKKILEFEGSLDGINQVMASLLYIPWCKIWPIPPNWNIPESIWMTERPNKWNIQRNNADPLKPNVWPPSYPRFWHPYPDNIWTRWPRVMPPFWLKKLCSDWTSTIHVEVEEITQHTCAPTGHNSSASFDFEIHVDAQTSPPKTVVARNIFTYFDPDVRSFNVTNVKFRSMLKEAEGKLRFEIKVNSSIAEVHSFYSGTSVFNCFSVVECNRYLGTILVEFHDNITNTCNLKIKIKLFREDSDHASDALVVWGIMSTEECINMMHNYKFNMESLRPYMPISVKQGGTVPLNINPNVLEPEMKGILNAFVYAEEGLVTVKASRDLRVFYDHMGMHAPNMTTFFSISGPAYDVIKALTTATFTPKNNFQGTTEVTVEYGMPPSSLRRVYNYPFGYPIPRRSLVIKVNVERGSLPASPILIHPQHLCSNVSDDGTVPLDMVEVRGRFKNDEVVNLAIYTHKGTLEQNITARYLLSKCRPVGDADSRPPQCALHNTCQDDEDCVETKKCCPQPADCGYRCDDPIEVVQITSFSKTHIILKGTTQLITDLFRERGILYSTTGCLTNENPQPKSYGIDTILFEMKSSRTPDKILRESMTLSVACRAQDASQVPIPVPQAFSLQVDSIPVNPLRVTRK